MRVSFPRGVGVKNAFPTLDAPNTTSFPHMILSRYGVGVTQGADSQDRGETWRQKRSIWLWPLGSRRE